MRVLTLRYLVYGYDSIKSNIDGKVKPQTTIFNKAFKFRRFEININKEKNVLQWCNNLMKIFTITSNIEEFLFNCLNNLLLPIF